MRTNDWVTCGDCEEEFKVVSTHERAEFCPFCGSTSLEIEEDLDDDEDDYFYDEEDDY